MFFVNFVDRKKCITFNCNSKHNQRQTQDTCWAHRSVQKMVHKAFIPFYHSLEKNLNSFSNYRIFLREMPPFMRSGQIL